MFSTWENSTLQICAKFECVNDWIKKTVGNGRQQSIKNRCLDRCPLVIQGKLTWLPTSSKWIICTDLQQNAVQFIFFVSKNLLLRLESYPTMQIFKILETGGPLTYKIMNKVILQMLKILRSINKQW